MLRHWIPVEKLNLKAMLLHNTNPSAITFLENGWYIKKEGDNEETKMSIDSFFKG